MKVLHTINSIDENAGGTATYMQLLADELTKLCDLLLIAKKTLNPLKIDDSIKFVEVKQTSNYLKNIVNFKRELNTNDVDIYHGNGVWQYPVHLMANVASKKKKPYVFSPHGMLEPWALNTRKWKKQAAMAIYQRKDLAYATCIHATAQQEAESVRRLGLSNPIAVIPNGIKLDDFPLPINKIKSGKKKILFLSRIHPKKGIEMLIDAWSQLDFLMRKDWQIEIVGNGEKGYIESLQKQIDDNKLEKQIIIIGPQFGQAKLDAYHRADLFVLPTYSENFGIVVVEALACGIPVITTKGAPWKDLDTHNAGWWIDIGVEPLINALEKALLLTEDQRMKMGQNCRNLVETKYSIEAVAYQMFQLYDWIINKSTPPDFIRFD